MRNRLLVHLASGVLLSTLAGQAMADRLTPSNLTYIGAFAVPMTNNYAGMGADGSAASISFRPNGDPSGGGDGFPGSLILSSKMIISEITIPAPIKTSNLTSLNVAKEIQSTSALTTGVSWSPADTFGAVAYLPAKGSQSSEKLYWSIYEYYNVNGDDYASLGWSNLTLSSPGAAGAWHVGPSANGNWDSPYAGNKYGDYIIPIDQNWANQYTGGKSLLVGRYREAGAAGGSMGPVLTAVAPWSDGNPPAAGSNLSAIPLMYFNTISLHTGDTTWMNFRLTNDPAYTYYSAGDRWHGGAWVTNGTSSAVIIVGRHGTYSGSPMCPKTSSGDGCGGAVGSTTPPYCYGVGGVDCPWGIAVTNNKGYHTGPYKPRFLFIDPADLAAVAQGTKAANTVNPFTVYDPSNDWPWSDSDGFNDVAGAAYDSANGYLYVVQSNANRPGGGTNTPWPVIHVYKIGGTGTTSTSTGGSSTPAATTPDPPSNVVVQ